MADPTGIALAVGGITAANEAIFAPLAGNGTLIESLNWRIIPATAIFAIALNGLAKLSPEFATLIGYTALITSLFVPTGKAGSVITNVDKVLGYNK
jgi:hypothetical protein